MGGNLLTKGKRTPRAKYLEIESKIRKFLDNEIGSTNYYIPRYYNTKSDFGDMDIILDLKYLVNPNYLKIGLKDKLLNHFDIKVTKTQHMVFSTLCDGLQVDYFSVHPDKLPTIGSYMDYGVGNYIGKIARVFNLKYGMDGLYYVYRGSDNRYKSELKISTDFKKIFELFDLDYAKWKSGFNDKYEAYNWVINSKYFSTYPYLNPKRGTRKRINERKDFKEFTEWLKSNNVQREFKFTSLEAIVDTIKYTFPNIDLDQFIKQCNSKYEKSVLIKSKFNGEIIMELLPNLRGKEIGSLINGFKNHINSYYGNFDDYILSMNRNVINHEIIKYYNGNK